MRMAFVNPHIFPYDFRGDGEWNSNRAMNYGILSIANYLDRRNVETDILDLQGEKEPMKVLETYVSENDPDFIGISCISALSYLPSLEIARKIKSMDSKIMVGVGGQHTRFIIENVFNDSPDIDIIATGEGEETSFQLYQSLKSGRPIQEVEGIAFTDGDSITINGSPKEIDLDSNSPVNFELYPNIEELFPLIEDSRGCPYGCVFCSNENVYKRRVRYKAPEIILSELNAIADLYGSKNLPLIFYNSYFGTNREITKKVLEEIRKSELDIRFMTSMRVDSKWTEYIDLFKGACDQMHLGLESASPEILIRMAKTKDPKHYIESATEAMRALSDKGVHVALNILTGYCGENEKSLEDTEAFLEKNRKKISSLRSHPLMLFPGSPLVERMDDFKQRFGSDVSKNKYSDKIHAYPVNATSEFSFEDAIEFGKSLMQKFNSQGSYYDYYKWLVGPVRTEDGIDFLPERDFVRMLDHVKPSKSDFKREKNRGK